MCGKDPILSPTTYLWPGSPPHVRERPNQIRWINRELGITPACAGKTRRLPRTSAVFEDHPRMCGKDPARPLGTTATWGSPPHVRERLFVVVFLFFRLGITPACAGKTHHGAAVGYCTEDHPRMCGKDTLNSVSISRRTGSPPHVRERLADVAYSCIAGGITPACAGKTAFVATDPNTVRDHPRMCGKDDCNYIIYRALKGSPPHVRERLATAFVTMLIMRITPACAGKTTYDIYQYTIYKDHPRMCGKDKMWGCM